MHAKLVALVGAALLLQSGAAKPVAADASDGCVCALIYSPVCAQGADGRPRRFGNECEANCAGISSESLRACKAGELDPPR
ncbi:hypothetical protein EsDP_00004520 [Epichloe bromicola]|uniref:Kazal-like domain-containing protein n=1 Tax=Epichloe bromicola TaxID=79588 RepID=A0ABQ0CS26_9HYPO